MTAQLIKRDGDDITLQITINLHGSLLEAEDTIQGAVNEIGCLATQDALKHFDADGTPMPLGDVTWTDAQDGEPEAIALWRSDG